MSNDVVVTKAALDGLRQNRDELRRAHRDAMAKADTLRRQRDEALRALRALTSHKDSKLSTDVEYIGIYQRAQRILAQCESEDAE